MKPGLNLIGPQVRKFRTQKGWSQAKLAEKLQLQGWNVSSNSLAKLELQLRRVSDCELLFFSKVLGVETSDLFEKNLPLKTLGPHFQANRRMAIFPTRTEK